MKYIDSTILFFMYVCITLDGSTFNILEHQNISPRSDESNRK